MGDTEDFLLPSYTQSIATRALKYTLEDPSNLVKIENGKILISGGTSANSGTHQVCIIATEPKSGVSNREAIFSL